MSECGHRFSRSMESSWWQRALNASEDAAAYVEDYIDGIENLPDDVQRLISQLLEVNVKHREVIASLEQQQGLLRRGDLGDSRAEVLLHIQHSLIESQGLGDDKLKLVEQILDAIENKNRQLEQDRGNLDQSCRNLDQDSRNLNRELRPQSGGTRRLLRPRVHDDDDKQPSSAYLAHNPRLPKKTRGRGASHAGARRHYRRGGRQQGHQKSEVSSPAESSSDPDESTYCVCKRGSFGAMILCDNQDCAIEWFHFSCVELTTKPKGRWYCPRCRGNRSNQINPNKGPR